MLITFDNGKKPTTADIEVVVVVEMNIIKVALSHFCCRTTVKGKGKGSGFI